MHFPPDSKPQKEDSYDVSRNGLNAEVLGQWIASRTGIHVSLPIVILINFYSSKLKGLQITRAGSSLV